MAGAVPGPHTGGSPRRDDITVDVIVALVDRGLTVIQMAKELKCSDKLIRSRFSGTIAARKKQLRDLGQIVAPPLPPPPVPEADVIKAADNGLPDGMIASLLGITLDQLLPRYRDVIDRTRSKLASDIAQTFVVAARGRAEVRDGTTNAIITPEIEPDLKAGEVLLNRLSFFEAPMDSELRVRVSFDDPPVRKLKPKAAGEKLRNLGD